MFPFPIHCLCLCLCFCLCLCLGLQAYVWALPLACVFSMCFLPVFPLQHNGKVACSYSSDRPYRKSMPPSEQTGKLGDGYFRNKTLDKGPTTVVWSVPEAVLRFWSPTSVLLAPSSLEGRWVESGEHNQKMHFAAFSWVTLYGKSFLNF